MDEKELQIQFQIFEQQIMQLQRQLQAVEQAILDIGILGKEMEDLKGKKDNEILSPLGKGIFAKTKLISEDLIVDVGDKTFVVKSIPETQKLIWEQSEKLENIKKELEEELDKINSEITAVMMKHYSKSKNPCDCKNENCECDSKEKYNCECDSKCNCKEKR